MHVDHYLKCIKFVRNLAVRWLSWFFVAYFLLKVYQIRSEFGGKVIILVLCSIFFYLKCIKFVWNSAVRWLFWFFVFSFSASVNAFVTSTLIIHQSLGDFVPLLNSTLFIHQSLGDFVPLLNSTLFIHQSLGDFVPLLNSTLFIVQFYFVHIVKSWGFCSTILFHSTHLCTPVWTLHGSVSDLTMHLLEARNELAQQRCDVMQPRRSLSSQLDVNCCMQAHIWRWEYLKEHQVHSRLDREVT